PENLFTVLKNFQGRTRRQDLSPVTYVRILGIRNDGSDYSKMTAQAVY
ncbi:MAG: hypothetical protein JWO07_329, partial [Candidatus Saccharibacteria bacterium]|nr:hypothetical protein [Candidatus Saccharibacteria bacterium]